jgi:hypothetical protein
VCSPESALETPTENKRSGLWRWHLKACVGGFRVSNAFRLLHHVICSIKVCLEEKKKIQEANVNMKRILYHSSHLKQYRLHHTYPDIGNTFERNYAKMTVQSSYYFRKLCTKHLLWFHSSEHKELWPHFQAWALLWNRWVVLPGYEQLVGRKESVWRGTMTSVTGCPSVHLLCVPESVGQPVYLSNPPQRSGKF